MDGGGGGLTLDGGGCGLESRAAGALHDGLIVRLRQVQVLEALQGVRRVVPLHLKL